MSIITDEEITKLTSNTSGMINSQVIELAKKTLLLGIANYITEDELNEVNNKVSNLEIKMLPSSEFEEMYYKCNGKGFLPGAFTHGGTVYFKNDIEFDKKDFHKLIHEMLHALSFSESKSGLFQFNKEKNYSYGRGLNEAFTEFMTSIILNESFEYYPRHFNYTIQMFMILTNLDIKDLFKLYISKDEWLSDDIINTFNPEDNELVGLIVEYDNLLNPNRKKPFDPNAILKFLFNSIKIKVNNNTQFDVKNIEELLKQYYNYWHSTDYEIEATIKTEMAETLDILGEYKHKISR